MWYLQGREWWDEAWRVLKDSGHFYTFCAIREIPDWLTFVGARAPLVDVIAWVAPNNPSLSAYWRRGIGGRAPAWRPILHWQKEPRKPIVWPQKDDVFNARTGRPMLLDDHKTTFVDPNFFTTASIQSTMREAEPWPNQLPVKLLAWLLRPHRGGTLLDLFSGTGTARVAAVRLGIDVVSVEKSWSAIEIIRQRGAQTGLEAVRA